ncbi:MAG: signal transduction histidine kinase [bacterium]|jgi:signal transduction histidine kinase
MDMYCTNESLPEIPELVIDLYSSSIEQPQEKTQLWHPHVEFFHPISIDADIPYVFDCFRKYQQRTFFPIVDEYQNPVGILRESTLKQYVYTQYGKEVLKRVILRDSPNKFISPTPIATFNTPIAKILEIFHNGHGTEGIVIVKDREYHGFLSAKSIIHLAYQREKEFTENLQKRKDELEIANRQKDKFFSIIAHDLKSSLNGVVGVSRLLVDLGISLDPNELQEMSLLMHESGESLLKLLENLLAWARMQMGVVKFQPDECSLFELVQSNLELFQAKIFQKKINMNIDVEECSVFLDQQMIHTVLRNLTSNALKFTPEKGSISISAKRTPNYLNITVQDSGAGIRDEDIKKLLRIDQHHTTEGIDNEKGTGLGLVLCKEMIDHHQGTIEIESVLGEGTTISLKIPQPTSPL